MDKESASVRDNKSTPPTREGLFRTGSRFSVHDIYTKIAIKWKMRTLKIIEKFQKTPLLYVE